MYKLSGKILHLVGNSRVPLSGQWEESLSRNGRTLVKSLNLLLYLT